MPSLLARVLRIVRRKSDEEASNTQHCWKKGNCCKAVTGGFCKGTALIILGSVVVVVFATVDVVFLPLTLYYNI